MADKQNTEPIKKQSNQQPSFWQKMRKKNVLVIVGIICVLIIGAVMSGVYVHRQHQEHARHVEIERAEHQPSNSDLEISGRNSK